MNNVENESLAKALHCAGKGYGDCAFCKTCRAQTVQSETGEDVQLCRIGKDNLMEAASARIRKIQDENQRLRQIIIKHMRSDEVCTYCKHFEQCKKESEIEDNYAEQTETRFWNCYDGRHFEPADMEN